MNSFPKCRSIIYVICNDGIHLSARVYGKQNKPRIIISHGNGLASDGYRIYWEGLIDEFEVIILDLRGHGQSELSSFDAHSYEQMIDDFE
jgi:predicted alpha/beta hydrolase